MIPARPPQPIAGSSCKGKGWKVRSNRRRLKRKKLRYALPCCLQYLVPFDSVERVLEVKIDEDVIGWKVMKVGPSNMGCCFCSQRHSKSWLERCQQQPHSFQDSPACHFCQQALKSVANRNWEHPSILLVQRCQRLQKRGCICVGVSPDSTRLVKDVSAVSSFCPQTLQRY